MDFPFKSVYMTNKPHNFYYYYFWDFWMFLKETYYATFYNM